MADELKTLFGVDQPIALVTGSGAARVGRSIARELVEAGYGVVLHANRSVDEVQRVAGSWSKEGFNVSYVTGAVDEARNADAWCKEILGRHGGLHVLVNSAAAWEPTSLDEMGEAELLEQWRVNLMGPALLCRAAGLLMAGQSHGGAIVNIGDWALARPYRDFVAYLLSKGAMESLTQTMAVELAHRHSGIRVNAVMPGPVMLDDRIGPDARRTIIEQSLVKREGTPKDVARAVRFLVESPFITGVCLPVDGGRTIYAGASHEVVAHPTYEKPTR